MSSTTAGTDQATYRQQVLETRQSLDTIDDSSLAGLSSLGIDQVQALKQEIAEIFPASNLPGFLLQGLFQMGERTIRNEKVRADLTVLFRNSKHLGVYSILAAPAVIVRGYQKLLALAGKDIDSAFPDGLWQFYSEFGLREDAGRHCVETLGFHEAAPKLADVDAATCWVYTAMRGILRYDDLLANEWYERVALRVLEELLHAQATGQLGTNLPDNAQEREQALVAAIDKLKKQYRVERPGAAWRPAIPFSGPPNDPTGDYPAYRRQQFAAFLKQTLRHLPANLRQQHAERLAAREREELPAFQAQLTLLVTLQADTYQDRREPLPLPFACVALVVKGRYYLLPVCATNDQGDLLLFPAHSTPDDKGVPLLMQQAEDGTLHDRYQRPLTFDRSGRVWAGDDRIGRLRLPPLARVKSQVHAVLQHSRKLPPPGGDLPPPLDVLLVNAPRSRQSALRGMLDPDTRADLEHLGRAPIVLNWDMHSPDQQLNTLRHTHRGSGDHALTLFRTTHSMVFDMSHICFDGVWGTLYAEILTRQAMALPSLVAQQTSFRVHVAEPLALLPPPELLAALREPGNKQPAEACAETGLLQTEVDMQNLAKLRRRLHKIDLRLTVNDVLVLGRIVHALRYHPGPLAQTTLDTIASLPNGPRVRQQIEQTLEAQRNLNPALLIPMDAANTDPRLRIFPATFRSPLHELPARLERCVALLEQNSSDARKQLEAERRTLYSELQAFGRLLQVLRDVTMRGENFNMAAVRLLGHLPATLQYLMSMIPQKIDMLNEVIKGNEVFSNVGQVVPSSSLYRFSSSRDDGDSKTLVWGIMSDAEGYLHITLRDFRPHVGQLAEAQRIDLAHALTSDYLVGYVATVNELIERILRVFSRRALPRHIIG